MYNTFIGATLSISILPNKHLLEMLQGYSTALGEIQQVILTQKIYLIWVRGGIITERVRTQGDGSPDKDKRGRTFFVNFSARITTKINILLKNVLRETVWGRGSFCYKKDNRTVPLSFYKRILWEIFKCIEIFDYLQ